MFHKKGLTLHPKQYKYNRYVYHKKSNDSRLRTDSETCAANIPRHIYFLAYEECEAAGYVSVQQQGEDLFHLQKIYVLPCYQGAHCGSFLFREAIKYIKEVHPGPCLMELNVNRNNKALQFYEHMGMRKLREGDFPIGNGYYMNDYIMGLEI